MAAVVFRPMEKKKSLQEAITDWEKEQCRLLLIKDPDKVPIILEKDPQCHLAGIKKTRHLIKKDFTVNKFLYIIKKMMKLPQDEALFLAAKLKIY